jgi:Fuc2NAc and GlcNAc transferase
VILPDSLLALIPAGVLLSWWLTSRMRRYALAAHLLDHPNERSSHTVPTPRGGGVAIVASFLAGILGLGLAGRIDASLCIAILGSGTLTATLGFIDDRGHVSSRWRLAGHMAAAAWVLACMGPLPQVPMLGVEVDLGLAAALLSGLFLVWSINLFNFMDGIDGIASLEAIGVSLGGAWLWWLVAPAGDWPVAVLFAACVCGFLIWNFPPARIFMGDAGSGFLGLVTALVALWSSQAHPHLFWSWMVLVGCFMVDATTTLVRRVKRGERFDEAHRSHAYQYAARRHGSHKLVSMTVLAINSFWLLPVAAAVALKVLDGVLGVAIAYAPLIWLARRYRAGDRAGQDS